ncbi:flavodoxin family protein [Oceanispirochaeta crateris]|uniref:Flavodoxin family protein n=1 Tax=Oceanispirochaeta crateris TaxID=2518645 RepID=A0A5C1QGD3_9SPIO|nr:NAD(P)H-dependent oxidoreductase [Oceanispirochaeta crateris]QEN06581.1 flavodoxin family protein [Oceanispirochaeta crateris]
MKTLIIFTHPAPESLNRSFLNSAMEGLSSNMGSDSVEVLDLYKENFNPALVFNDEKRRRSMSKDPELESYRKMIQRADTILLIYPLWWGRPPAMLMGFFDKVLSSGFAYKQTEGKILPEGLLKGKRVICVSTMKGPKGYPALVLRNAHKVLMKKAIFNFVGIKKVKFFEFGSMESPRGKQEKKLEKIKDYMQKLKPV